MHIKEFLDWHLLPINLKEMEQQSHRVKFNCIQSQHPDIFNWSQLTHKIVQSASGTFQMSARNYTTLFQQMGDWQKKINNKYFFGLVDSLTELINFQRSISCDLA